MGAIQSQVYRRGRIFYGWWMVMVGTILSALGTGLFFNGMTAFIGPMSRQFGWPASVFSLGVSLSRLSHIVTGPTLGWLVDRFGPRRIIFVGIPWMALGFILLSQVNSKWSFYLVFLGLISLGAGASMGPVSVAVGNWFIRKRGRALGIVMAGLAGSSALVYPLTLLMGVTSWRTAALAAGILVFVVSFPLAFLIRHKPEQYGYLPDGDTRVVAEGSLPTAGGPAPRGNEFVEVNFSPKQTLRSYAFWAMSISFGIRHLVTHGLALFMLPLLASTGVGNATAAALIGFFGLIAIPSRIGIAWLGDIFPKRHVMGITTFLIAAAVLWGSQMQGKGMVAALIFVALYAPAYGGAPPLMSAMMAEYFGRRNLGANGGLQGMVTTVGQTIGPLFIGLMYDASGSYGMPLLIFGVLNLAAAFVLFYTKRPVLRAVQVTATSDPAPKRLEEAR